MENFAEGTGGERRQNDAMMSSEAEAAPSSSEKGSCVVGGGLAVNRIRVWAFALGI